MRKHTETTKAGWVKITSRCIVDGRHRELGELVEVDAGSMRQLLREGLAVPAAGPGRMLTSDGSTAKRASA